jgi:hypothetical protein
VTQAEFAQGESSIGDYLHRTAQTVGGEREQLRKGPDSAVFTADDNHVAADAHAHRDSRRGCRTRLEQPTVLLYGRAERLAR